MFEANISVNLIKNGYMGIPGIEKISPFEFQPRFKGLDKHFYAQPPLNVLTRSIWFKFFGIGLLQQRYLSIFFGLIGLLSWLILLLKLKTETRTILISLILISTDFIYTRFSAHGRSMDIMCAALAFASWASYLSFREKNFSIALLVSHILIVMSGMTHPNGILGWIGLLFLILYHDHNKLRLKHILISLIPYFIAGVAWGLYIIQDIDAFYHQFFGNIFGLYYPSYKGVTLQQVRDEIFLRYLFAYGFSDQFPIYSRILVFILFVYLISYILLLFFIKNNYQAKVIFSLTTIYILSMTFISGRKWPAYLVHIIPLYATCVGILYNQLKEKSLAKNLITFAIIFMILLSSGVNIWRFKRDEYHKRYLTDIKYLLQILSPQDTIIAPWETSFDIGFDRVLGDHTLGYFSKMKPDIIVIDPAYECDFKNFQKNKSEIFDHIQKLLREEYKLVYEGKLYKIYKKTK